jgi:hypothetical protein
MVLIIPLIVYQRVYSHREKLGQPRAAKWFLTRFHSPAVKVLFAFLVVRRLRRSVFHAHTDHD